ncbi:hypothetical protein V5O48_013465 [Marasmius crinis-equi]
MLHTESTRVPYIDVYNLDNTIKMIMMCCRYNPDVQLRMLSKNVAKHLVEAMACYLPRSATFKSGDVVYVFHGVASTFLILGQCFDDGFTWASQALDAGLLPTLIDLFLSDLVKRADGRNRGIFRKPVETKLADMEQVNVPIVVGLTSLKTLLIFRSVLNRVYRYMRRLPKEQLKYLMITVPQVGTALLRLSEEAVRLKHLMWKFDRETWPMVCCNRQEPNKPCRRSERRHKAGKRRVKWKRCLACQSAIYCSEKCQEEDWANSHSIVCKGHRRSSNAQAYRISTLDEAFILHLVSLEIDKPESEEKLKSIWSKSLRRSEPIVAQFDFREVPMKLKAVPYEEVLKGLQTLGNKPRCTSGNLDCCSVERRPCCDVAQRELKFERSAWHRETEVICQVMYLGLDCHSSFVWLKHR